MGVSITTRESCGQFSKTDVIPPVRSARYWAWALAGAFCSAHFSGIAAQVGWAPFLAIIGFGFATWGVHWHAGPPKVHFPDLKKRWLKAGTCFFLRPIGGIRKKLKSFNTTSPFGGALAPPGDTHPRFVASQLGAVPEFGG
ncbi:MAG: hypothetical protein CM15mP74_32610 [Halieaceae bacterium]|nr:MAG: hypothetical protein CM15mP74_32610 [Halieaceae bacterium]